MFKMKSQIKFILSSAIFLFTIIFALNGVMAQQQLPEMTGALDLWGLFVNYIFGGFWFAVIGLAFLMFVVMMIGRISIYSITWYLAMFLLAMGLGYGYVIVNIFITLVLIVVFFFAWKGYLDRGGT